MLKKFQSIILKMLLGYVCLIMLTLILSLMFDFLSLPSMSSIFGPVVCAKHAEAVKHTDSLSEGGEA